MFSLKNCLVLMCCLVWAGFWAQEHQRQHFDGSDGQRAFFPLGYISFADRVESFKMGFPKPLSKFRDSSQCLSRPDYHSYSSADFVSLGCGGTLTVEFTDNGFMNLPGKDLYVFEVGPARERTRVEISPDGKQWHEAGIAEGGTSWLDFEAMGIDKKTLFHYVRLTDLRDECDGKSAGADIDAVGAVNSVIALDIASDVLFDVDRSNLKPTAQLTIDTLVAIIRTIPEATVRIEGHTDSDGSVQYNQMLSKNRCSMVQEALRSQLRSEGTYVFQTHAYGESKPRLPNNSDANKQLNRRVEIYVLPPESYYEKIKE